MMKILQYTATMRSTGKSISYIRKKRTLIRKTSILNTRACVFVCLFCFFWLRKMWLKSVLLQARCERWVENVSWIRRSSLWATTGIPWDFFSFWYSDSISGRIGLVNNRLDWIRFNSKAISKPQWSINKWFDGSLILSLSCFTQPCNQECQMQLEYMIPFLRKLTE